MEEEAKKRKARLELLRGKTSNTNEQIEQVEQVEKEKM